MPRHSDFDATAGGIGGLLAVSESGAGVPPAVYYPCYDANGNIAA